jgi:hypothetical protein
MSNLQTRLQQAADEAARLGRTSGPDAVIRRGRQRRRRLIGGTASLVVLMLVAGGLGTGRLASRQSPLAPAPTTAPTATSVTRIPAAVTKPVKLDVQVHLGPAGFPDRFGMASDLTTVMEKCGGGTSQVRMCPRSGCGPRCWGRPGCWPPRNRSQRRTGSAGRTASGTSAGLPCSGATAGQEPAQAAPSQPAGQHHRWQGRTGGGGWPRHQTSGPAADPVPPRTPDRPCAHGGRIPIPGQVLRRVLPPAGKDGLDARTRGRLRSGRPPHRRVLGNHRPGQRL